MSAMLVASPLCASLRWAECAVERSLQGRHTRRSRGNDQKASSAYLWKPHADALTYLLSTLERVNLEAEQVKKVAQGRGLQDKATAVETSLEKLKKYANTVSQTLQAANEHYSS